MIIIQPTIAKIIANPLNPQEYGAVGGYAKAASVNTIVLTIIQISVIFIAL